MTTYKFTYKHYNHSVFKGEIVAHNEEHRDKLMLNLLYSRYRRKLSLDGVVFVEVKEG
jgi:hypothetical protein